MYAPKEELDRQALEAEQLAFIEFLDVEKASGANEYVREQNVAHALTKTFELQRAIDDGNANRIGNAVVGSEVDEASLAHLRNASQGDNLGRALITGGKTDLQLHGSSKIGDRVYIDNSTVVLMSVLTRPQPRPFLEDCWIIDSIVRGNTTIIGSRRRPSIVDEESTVQDSTVKGSDVNHGSKVSSSTITEGDVQDHSDIIEADLWNTPLYHVRARGAEGTSNGQGITGKLRDNACITATMSEHVQVFIR